LPSWALPHIHGAVGAALDAGQTDALLALRALQTELFVSAVERSSHPDVADASADPELTELGGPFLERANQNGWRQEGQFLLRPEALAALFRMRWNHLTGLLEKQPFAPTLNEWRVYYRVLLEHPDVPPEAPDAVAAGYQLQIVESVGALDPQYPLPLARGLLLTRTGRFEPAAAALRAYLGANPSGRWQLRAQNALATLAPYFSP
jgi:hypothetical protein